MKYVAINTTLVFTVDAEDNEEAISTAQDAFDRMCSGGYLTIPKGIDHVEFDYGQIADMNVEVLDGGN